MEVTAKLNNAPISAQKGRLIARLISKLTAANALNILRFTPKKGARLMLKVLESAIANAENNHGIDVDELAIRTVCVDEGPTLKRMQARAKGRGNRISLRSSHITLTLSSEE